MSEFFQRLIKCSLKFVEQSGIFFENVEFGAVQVFILDSKGAKVRRSLRSRVVHASLLAPPREQKFPLARRRFRGPSHAAPARGAAGERCGALLSRRISSTFHSRLLSEFDQEEEEEETKNAESDSGKF